MKVALVHDYLNQYGGAEKTLEALIELFPTAPVYTGIYNPKSVSDTINKAKIRHCENYLLGRFPKHLTFLMPFVFESFDLSTYDIIISEGTAWPKGVLTKPDQLHISYIHTPARFLYKYSVESQNRSHWYYKPFVAIIDHYLRIWDFISAQRPDFLVANSQEVQRRIAKFYRREAKVIYPPVEINTSRPKPKDNMQSGYYLAIGRLSAYKNFDLIIQGFNLLELPLVIIGTGKEERRLRRLAKSNITFLGQVSEDIKQEKLANCLGVIFPVVEEDLGIVPIEAMSYGKPVLAHRSGGVLETVRNGIDGMFFDAVSVASFVAKMKEFDEKIRKKVFNAQIIKQNVQKFSKERFKKEFWDFVLEKWHEKSYTAGTIR